MGSRVLAHGRLVLLAGLLVANAAQALPITYSIFYDPTTLTTTINNSASSQAWLWTFPIINGARGPEVWLQPGGQIQVVGGGGNVVVNGGSPKPPDPFITNTINTNGKPMHIVGPAPPVPGVPWTGPEAKPKNAPDSAYQPIYQCVWINGCIRYRYHRKGPAWGIEDPAQVILDPTAPDDLLDTGVFFMSNDPNAKPSDPNATVSLFSPIVDYPAFYPPGQFLMEIDSGGWTIQTDSSNFTSAFTPNAGTGCPEPGTLALMLAGGYTLVRRRRSAQPRKT